VDLQAMRDPNDFARDMTRLKASSAAIAMPFGIIVWGNNGDSDTLYAADAERLVQSISDAFANWPGMPEHIILQSWAVSSTGARITPVNLPEGRAYTHTNLLWSVFRRLRGQTGKGSDIAVRVTG
jgi:hypothetical protein